MIGVVIAMDSEAQILLDCMQIKNKSEISQKAVYIGTAFGKEIALIICGVGKVNAAIGTQIVIDKFGVEKLFNFGVAGGLNASTDLCAVYQIEKAVQFDFDLTQLNGTAMGTLDEYSENYLYFSTFDTEYQTRALGTSDRFNDSPADYALLTEILHADIRDMEGGAILQTAVKAGLPVYCVKAISDVAGNGSTTEQFLENRSRALQNLKEVLPEFFQAL
ncbi:MAG: 5'-methylthioadenosine/S-adenosylhomocysteine nucleosidase [Clostridia bacterium]|nr:5'-methylthioadenosine/S-adenosylhomocysteine nucleosidase [Clostridia bacterium]